VDDPPRSDEPTGQMTYATHWDRAYGDRAPSAVSWFQPVPAMSLQLIDLLGVPPEKTAIDVGGGASLLVDNLVDRGFLDVTVLDISATALEQSRRRLGNPAAVRWIRNDLRTWQPERVFDLWHDRAVFHFLTRRSDRDTYLRLLKRATRPGSAVIIGAFAPEGPDQCSGLPVNRYSAEDLGNLLGRGFEVVATRSEVHRTPGGVVQPFAWVAGRRTSNHPPSSAAHRRSHDAQPNHRTEQF
jgi:SAM-dependent methyltransferase